MDNQNEISQLDEVNDARSLDLEKTIIMNNDGDKEVPVFLLEWLSNGLNASLAYKKLHPEVSDGSARVLGSRKLTKVNISALLTAYDMGYEAFFDHLRSGLEASKYDEVIHEQLPDHRARVEYLKILGKLLGLIKEK